MKRHCGAMYRFYSTQRYIHGREVARDRRCEGMVVTGETGRVVFTFVIFLLKFECGFVLRKWLPHSSLREPLPPLYE